MMLRLWLSFGMMLAAGCARYEYDLTSPQLRAIVADKEETLRLDPIDYRMRVVENRLVLQISNTASEPLALAGEKSYVVSPDGQSHPLRGQTIAPGSFAKLILPPMRPHYERSGPSIGIGIGYNLSSSARPGPGSYSRDPWWLYEDSPSYLALYDPNDAGYWDWEGQTDIRLSISFSRPSGSFTHDLAFHRRQVK